MSDDESPPDLDLARRLVADQFPQWAGLAVREVEHSGWDNRTYRLGDQLSIRLPRSRHYREQVAKEQHWLPLLAPQLPLPIPRPVGWGRPGPGYPYDWSVYEWIDGAAATPARIEDPVDFARQLAGFLVALRSCDTTDGPLPGHHNFWRGGPLTHYLAEARTALAALADELTPAEAAAASDVLSEAVASRWQRSPVWFHGDVAFGNLLVRDGRLAAVIDFGTSGIGDPACDVVLAWTLLSGAARRTYRDVLALDHDTWARGRGWGLWKALITVAGHRRSDLPAERAEAEESRRVIREILAHTVG